MQLKIVHANSQSIQKKHLQLKSLLNDIGPNCIYGLTETWLTSTDLFHADSKTKTTQEMDIW